MRCTGRFVTCAPSGRPRSPGLVLHKNHQRRGQPLGVITTHPAGTTPVSPRRVEVARRPDVGAVRTPDARLAVLGRAPPVFDFGLYAWSAANATNGCLF
jgi:hypothetical protein